MHKIQVFLLECLAIKTQISIELNNHLVQWHFSISPSKCSSVLTEMGVYVLGNQTKKITILLLI